MDHPEVDVQAAGRVHYTDPRVRRLAYARWLLVTGRPATEESFWAWLGLGKDNPDALIQEARDWVRASVAAGILPPPEEEAS
jgi:hypothetical protein